MVLAESDAEHVSVESTPPLRPRKRELSLGLAPRMRQWEASKRDVRIRAKVTT